MLVRIATALMVIGWIASCGSGESDGVQALAGDAETDSTLPVVDLSATPEADATEPARRAGAASNFVDCEHGLWQGGWSMDFGPLGAGPDPDAAIAALADSALLASPPADGFVPVARDEGRIAYTYEVDGRSRFAAVAADSEEVALEGADRWVVEVFASCDPAEFDPSADGRSGYEIWLDADGDRLPTSVAATSAGPEHCGWESVTFLTVDGLNFVADPQGVLGDENVVAAFDDDAELPADAVDTGYHRGGTHLWLASDASFAFVVDGNDVHAWPALTQHVGCG